MSDLVTDNLPLITTAPDGIKRLRGLILELAVRGKLVPQDPNDEPANELLKRIEAEKARLVKEGKIRKPKQAEAEDSPSFDVIADEVPHGWAHTTLGDTVEIVRGITFPASEKSKSPENGRIGCIRTANVQDRIEWDDLLYIKRDFVSRGDQFLAPNDIVISMANSRELVGKVSLVSTLPQPEITFGGFLGVIRPHQVLPGLIMCLLRAPTVRNELIDSASQTTNIANISLGKLRPLRFALPPLPEQHRIVARVDELMALCDRLEAEQTDAAEAHARLVDALLATLTASHNAAECATHWQRLSEHFDTLFTTEASIAALKQTVLQLAVMGRLVPQDPICEAFERISKKVISNPQTCEIPPNWQMTALGELCEVCGGMTPTKSRDDYWGDGMPWVSPKDMKVNFITDAQDHITERALSETTIRPIQCGSLLVVVRGMILAHSFPVAITRVEVTINQDMKALIPRNPTFAPYLMLVCKGFKQDILNLVERSSHGTCKLETPKLLDFSFGLPPPHEQHRIVAKVDELMVLCDSLQADLHNARASERRIADALTTIG